VLLTAITASLPSGVALDTLFVKISNYSKIFFYFSKKNIFK
jgi:hypothetical protein